MRYHYALLVFRKDWQEIRRNWQIALPIIVIPFIFSILFPILMIGIPISESPAASSTQEFASLIARMPVGIRDQLAEMNYQQVIVYLMALYLLAPFFLIIPIMTSSVIASDSFAGEKERKTIEALFATPLSDSELFFGKVLVSFVPAMAVTFGSFLVYSVMVNIISYPLFEGKVLLPNLIWLVLIFGLSPLVALTSIGLTVLISARVKGLREAQQISAVLLVPILILIFGQISGAMFLGPSLLLVLIVLFVFVDLFIFRLSIKLFRREEILSRLA